jgi:hypothetical protein
VPIAIIDGTNPKLRGYIPPGVAHSWSFKTDG